MIVGGGLMTGRVLLRGRWLVLAVGLVLLAGVLPVGRVGGQTTMPTITLSFDDGSGNALTVPGKPPSPSARPPPPGRSPMLDCGS